jgi:hypothetical protein
MNKQIGYFIVLINIFLFNYTYSQDSLKSKPSKMVSAIFLEDQILPIKLSYSIKDIKKNTNDTTYINSTLTFQSKADSWQTIPIELRARGNYRLKNCYFPPLKIKLKKSDTKNTIFEGNKTLKFVLPCLIQSDNDDNVIKEYLAYKLFEIISPYHFKTRLIDVALEELKGKKTREHEIKGFLIEDDKTLAKRLDGKVYDRFMHPLNHEALFSIRNAFFQFMIGNTDFSQAYQHNMKVVYIDKEMIPIPYDFDMSGFVNCSYAVVSQIQGESLGMTSVTQRKYRGFKRDFALFEQVRKEYLSNKLKMLAILDTNKSYFKDSKEFSTAREYVLSFFDILSSDDKFKYEILNNAREE